MSTQPDDPAASETTTGEPLAEETFGGAEGSFETERSPLPATAPLGRAPGAPAESARAPRGGIREWFWRGETLALAQRVQPAERQRVRDVVELSDQRGEAAETLWTSGHAAEALRLAVDGFAIAEALAPDRAALETDAKLTRRVALARTAAGKALPSRDHQMEREHTDRYQDVQAGRRALVRHGSNRVVAATELRWQRVRRIGGVVLAALALAVIAVLLLRTPPRVDVSASGQFPGNQYAPANAFDDDESTEWVLPDEQSGWIEGRLEPPRNVTSVRLLNGRNGHFGDRGTKRYRVQLLRGDEVVAEHEGAFRRIQPTPEWVRLPLRGDGISRIRVEAQTHHQRGAALAEVAWDE